MAPSCMYCGKDLIDGNPSRDKSDEGLTARPIKDKKGEIIGYSCRADYLKNIVKPSIISPL